MRINRFIGNFDLAQTRIKILDREIIHQMQKVLRLKIGDRMVLGDGKAKEVLVQIVNFQKDLIEAEPLECHINANEPKKETILYCSILKKENFETVVQKATEAGIREIVPIIVKRTVKLNINEERLQKIIKEAAEQSGRGILPILNKTLSFEEAMEHAKQNCLNLFFDKSGISIIEKHAHELLPLEKRFQFCQQIGIFIGPEGGWHEDELKIANERKFMIVSLGKTTLRAETAAIVGTYIVSNEII